MRLTPHHNLWLVPKQETLPMLNTLLFIVFPYVAVLLTVVVGLARYFYNRYSYSSLSSQLVESKVLFWGAVPWHYGVVPILIIHLAGFTIPSIMHQIHSQADRLYIAELIGKFMAFLALLGILILIIRRLSHSKLRLLTTPLDWIVLLLLLNQIFLGLWVSLFYRWGAVWFLETVSVWVGSLAKFQPQTLNIAPLPLIPKLHFLNATLLIALFPFTRLVHMMSFPITYLWRHIQVFIWNRRLANKGT
ncbi:MAG: respiratory nitrate reductase subunit gamma [Anaerolineales bacterium]|nr:respiratory nitrate reductase subunit gamma [Anaerolineae bacterium]PWB53568.1 MAG: respiratory nitrate reductase subunit gamma [Anaerolineales bacterium]